MGHARWVFTIPKMLRPYFPHHRELPLSWQITGFSVHNSVTVGADDPASTERLARYLLRPPRLNVAGCDKPGLR